MLSIFLRKFTIKKIHIIASANTGCAIQLAAGLKQRHSATQVMHIVEILDVAYKNDGLYDENMPNLTEGGKVGAKYLLLPLTVTLGGWMAWTRKKTALTP